MANRVVLLQDGKYVTAEGSANGQVLTWSEDTNTASFQAGGGGGSGTVTSVGLTGGTSGIVIGGTASPITTSGEFNLDAPLRFAFDTATPTAVAAAGQVSYNTDEGSLEQMFDGGHVKSVLGQTLHQRVLNDTGSTLTKGQVVYVSGAQGNRVTVSLAQADADSTSATIIGVIAYAIADGAEGYVITEGLIKGVNTNGFTEGLPVYLSPTTAGALTQTKPEAPQHLVLVGYCVRADATVGEILIKTQNGYELGELHDVYINSPTSGQILIYDATTGQTRWENASLTGTANQITVTPGAGSLTLSLPSTLNPTAASTAVAFTLQGGAGSGSGSAGAGLKLYGGAAGGGNANGGSVEIDGGANAGSGTKGDVSIGTGFTTNRVLLGSSNVQTNLGGLLYLANTTNSAILANLSDVVPLSSPLNSATVTLTAKYVAGLTGAGKNLSVTGGAANNANGNGGALSLLGGAKTGSGTNGAVNLGTSNTSAVTIGATGITTTVDGTLSLANALAVASGGTNNASLSVAAGTVYYGDGTRLVGLAPGTSGQFLQSQGAAAPQWASAGSATTPYDVLGRFAGNPATNAVLYSSPVPRSVTVSLTTSNHYFYASALPSAGTSVITVYKTLASNGTKSALFTATWTAGQAAASNGLYQAVISTVSNNTLVAGDVLSVEMGTTNTSFVNPQFAVSATA